MHKKLYLMIGIINCWLLMAPGVTLAQDKLIPEKYQRLSFGSIKPAGWIKVQMQKDMEGFVGNLDKLVPELINESIYGRERLHTQSKSKDLGNLKAGNAAGDEQYKWWNSETQSNWRDGYIRNALLLDDKAAKEKVKTYINGILATQDEDGYLGIYDKGLRYKFISENGELWAKTTLYRGLLAYYEYTNDQKVWQALVRAVDNVMQNYPINHSQPFYAGKDFAGGVAHGLTFTDILDRMYQLTGDQKYVKYATFLYHNFSENFSSEKDAQLDNILDPKYTLQTHGAHTYEHLRPLLVAAYSSEDPILKKALDIYVSRIKKTTTMTGGAIGDEWIAGRTADATHTGYEYCSLQELMDSYCSLFQKSGNTELAGLTETIFYNAAQGSRNPDHSCIAYLKTDNSYEMLGTKNGEVETDKKQTRYKYSPAHQDVAVCCNPNAGRITPYFLQSMWLKENKNTLVASLLGPNTLKTSLLNSHVSIEEITDYPYKNQLKFKISLDKPLTFKIKVRKPHWASGIETSEKYHLENDFMVFERTFQTKDEIRINFRTVMKILTGANNEKYFSYGALIFAKPINAKAEKGRIYEKDFADLYYRPMDSVRFGFLENHNAKYMGGKLYVNLRNHSTGAIEKTELIPFGKTILRQVSFKK